MVDVILLLTPVTQWRKKCCRRRWLAHNRGKIKCCRRRWLAHNRGKIKCCRRRWLAHNRGKIKCCQQGNKKPWSLDEVQILSYEWLLGVNILCLRDQSHQLVTGSIWWLGVYMSTFKWLNYNNPCHGAKIKMFSFIANLKLFYTFYTFCHEAETKCCIFKVN